MAAWPSLPRVFLIIDIITVFVCIISANQGVALDNPVPFEIDKDVKEHLLDDEVLYQRQKEQEVDDAVQDKISNEHVDPQKAAKLVQNEEGVANSDEEELEGKNMADLSSSKLKGSDLGFIHAFVAALSVIIVSEIGDKTFFIAAILSMRHSRLIVFGGALSALGVMTFLSVVLGSLTVIIPRWVTFYVCTALLGIFGVKMLYEAWKMSPNEGQEEFEEVSAELNRKESQSVSGDVEQGTLTSKPPFHRRFWFLSCITPIFIQAFTLTFLAEWGDRSQLTTIILSARENPIGVTLGGTFGHALCTALAVLGGKIISEKISVRTVTFIGGVVFLVFVLTAFLHNPNNENEI